MLSFPSQIMVFAVVALLGVSVQNVIIANVFIKWAWYAPVSYPHLDVYKRQIGYRALLTALKDQNNDRCRSKPKNISGII